MKKRVVYFDILNILAALSVIFLHCNGIAHFFSDTPDWRQALGVEVLCFWAVPVFLMLSGATLMSYRESYSTAEFFKRRILRTVIPFLAWSLIMAAVKDINPFEIGVCEFLSKLFLCSIEGVYWFFIPLFAVYISIPVLSLLKDNKKILIYMLFGSMIFNSLLPEIFAVIKVSWNGSLSMLTMGGYLIFPVLGYLLNTTDFTKVQRGLIYLSGIAGVIFRYVTTFCLSMRDASTNIMFFSYTGWYSVCLAAAVFVFIKYLPLCDKLAAKEKAVKILKTVSSCSFGVYLLHNFVRMKIEGSLVHVGWEWRIFGPFLVYALCLAATFIMKKIPLVKHIVP
ncbi:MAG: acyltransferase [Clostridiales bacterium]|nr:acyltransferase [Clostridiales bacterium]